MTSTNWAEEEDRKDGEYDLPATVVEFDQEKGIKRETCYRIDERDLIKDIREYRFETKKVSHTVALRNKWKKFGGSESDPPGPNPSYTFPGEEVFMKFVNEKELDNDDDDDVNKLKGKEQQLKCRTCGGAHFSHKCPYKEELASIKEITDRLEASAAAAAAGEDTPEANPSDKPRAPEGDSTSTRGSRTPGAYLPPSLRGKGAGGESLGGPGSRRQDDGYTLRVSNLPEDTRDNDLSELFNPFGRVQRIYLAKDKITNLSKGFAFVTYTSKEDASKALSGVNGFGYDHLILTVEWAKPSNN